MMVILFIGVLTQGKPSRAVYYLLMNIVNVFFTITLKLIWHLPRPYMVMDGGVKVIGQSFEFGDPSGHLVSCAQVLTTVFLDYISSEGEKKSWIKNMISCVLIVIVFILVGYSRMFNGVHTLDQVLTGLLIGLWTAIFGHCIFR